MYPGSWSCSRSLPGVWCILLLRSRGSTGRTRTNPMGDSSCRSTRLGNLLTARTLILLWVLAAKGCWWIVEQPSSSLMEFHVLFQRFLSLIRVRRLSICMADYGSPTLKPTYLYSSHSKLEIQDELFLDSSQANFMFYKGIKIRFLSSSHGHFIVVMV